MHRWRRTHRSNESLALFLQICIFELAKSIFLRCGKIVGEDHWGKIYNWNDGKKASVKYCHLENCIRNGCRYGRLKAYSLVFIVCVTKILFLNDQSRIMVMALSCQRHIHTHMPTETAAAAHVQQIHKMRYPHNSRSSILVFFLVHSFVGSFAFRIIWAETIYKKMATGSRSCLKYILILIHIVTSSI